MIAPILDSLVSLLNTVLGHEVGTDPFYIVFGITVFAVFFVARLLVALFGSDKGFIQTSFGMLLPVVFGLTAYVLIEVYAVPMVDESWASLYLPGAGFVLLVVGGIIVFTTRLFDRGFGGALFIFVISAIAGVGAWVCSGIVADYVEQSGSEMEQRQERLKDDIDGI
ncbi:MAG: hypothetical protein ACSHX8_11700 [Opitutaceae bacterium]